MFIIADKSLHEIAGLEDIGIISGLKFFRNKINFAVTL